MDNKGASLEFMSSVGQIWHGWLCKNTHLAQSETSNPPKLRSPMKIFQINLDIILYCAFSLDFYEYLTCYIYLHSNDSCWTKNLVSFTLDIKLNTFSFIFFTLSGINIWAYGSSVVYLPPHFLKLTINGHKGGSLEFTSSVGLIWHGWLFEDTHLAPSETSNPPKLHNPINIF